MDCTTPLSFCVGCSELRPDVRPYRVRFTGNLTPETVEWCSGCADVAATGQTGEVLSIRLALSTDRPRSTADRLRDLAAQAEEFGEIDLADQLREAARRRDFTSEVEDAGQLVLIPGVDLPHDSFAHSDPAEVG